MTTDNHKTNDAQAEIERLTACLKTANANAEKFEREWYLRGDEIEALHKSAVSPEWVRNGIADFVADNWPDRKYTLDQIEAGLRQIEINIAAVTGAAK